MTTTPDSFIRAGLELCLDSTQRAFRDEVREFLANEMGNVADSTDPTDLTGCSLAFETEHQRRAGERGFLAISAPCDYGGGDRSPSYRAIYSYEAAYYDAPSIDTAMVLCGAPILAFGTEEQKQRLVPPMARGEVLACIAFSEAQAGSDLRAIETLALPIDDSFLLTGAKALVTGAHKAQWCLTIARTDSDADAISAFTMFVVPLDLDGIRVRRRATANGWTLSEITFDDVVLGPDNVLGVVGQGWTQMAAALVDERSGVAWLGWARQMLDKFALWAQGLPEGRQRDDAQDAIVDCVGNLAVGFRLADRVLREQDGQAADPTNAAMSKVWATELLQSMAATMIDIVGVDALAWSPVIGNSVAGVPLGGRIAWEYLERIHPTISVGANELQRDAIARAALKGTK